MGLGIKTFSVHLGESGWHAFLLYNVSTYIHGFWDDLNLIQEFFLSFQSPLLSKIHHTHLMDKNTTSLHSQTLILQIRPKHLFCELSPGSCWQWALFKPKSWFRVVDFLLDFFYGLFVCSCDPSPNWLCRECRLVTGLHG